MFEGHPKGLWALALANTGERFGYYTMLAVFFLFLQHNFGFSVGTAGTIQATFLGVVYFVPLFGGMLADKFGFGKMVTIGILVMNYEQIRFLSSATIMDHLIYSTTGDGMPKEEFKKEMEDRISFFAYDYNIQRKSIGIKSFLRGSENLEKQTERIFLW